VEFRILGPLEVVEDGRPISIRRGKEQALLAYLLLHANEVVPSGTLIDVLWNERPPATASKILQNGVSHLRKQLGDGRLETRDPGYLLRVEKDELDLDRFERLASIEQLLEQYQKTQDRRIWYRAIQLWDTLQWERSLRTPHYRELVH
jgi:DNA-binding SARP family transcriptional activator